MSAGRVIAVGDSFMPEDVFADALRASGVEADIATISLVEPTWPVDRLREFEGDPAALSELIDGHEVLLVHGAPVSREVLESNPSVRLVGCARGGPVNVDLAAAHELGVQVTTSPGKNAAAVADLTIGFVISLLRNLLPSVRDVDSASVAGRRLSDSAFEGARWIGGELGGRTLGLVGLGNVARLVAERAIALDMDVVAYDPFVAPGSVPGVRRVDALGELLAQSAALSVHARATEENRELIGAPEFGTLPRGAVFVNTARATLVDEHAMLAALRSGHLSGVALDVCEPDGPWRELVEAPNVILTPHIAGATHETLRRGAEMLVAEVLRWRAGDELLWRM